MGRSKFKSSGRDGSRFVALPHTVLDSIAYQSLSFSARALLVDISRQFSGSNNGKLVLCAKALKPRGWNSSATIHKAKKELLGKGLLFETRKGAKPNKASWFAITWQSLDWLPEMDISKSSFRRGGYLENEFRPPKNGVGEQLIAPENGVRKYPTTPENGAMRAI